MPSRQLPRTEEGRYNALRNAKTKAANTPGQTVIQAATLTQVDDAETELKALIQNSNIKLEEQTSATALVEQSFYTCRMWYSHLIQHLNDAIARNDAGFIPSVRAYYNINVNDDKVPEINSYDDLKTRGQQLIDGEADRVAAGGTNMSFPKVSEFKSLQFVPFITNLIAQSIAKDAFDIAQEAIQVKIPTYDTLIKRTWNEIELAFSDEAPASKRRKAREWGVVYTTAKGEKLKLDIPPSSTLSAPDFEIENDMHFSAKNTGTVALLICRSADENTACPTGITVNAGETKPFKAIDLAGSGNLLNITNLDLAQEGHLLLEVI
jgi:hypothetical protein